MKRRILLAATLLGCHRPVDVGPIRAELAADVGIVCTPPRPRPAHAPAASTSPTVPEIEDAATKVCKLGVVPNGNSARHCESIRPLDDACRSRLAEAASPLSVIFAGLREDRAVVGAARHSHLLYGPSPEPTCDPGSPAVDDFVLASARDLAERGHADGALERCADYVAMQRDLAIDATMLDAMVVTNRLQQARRICEPFIAAATPSAAQQLADALAAIRSSIPPIAMVLPRDRAEVMLSTFGSMRAPDLALGCDRAKQLVARSPPQSDDAARKVWDEIAKAGPPRFEKYGEEYDNGLLALATLTSAAAERR